MPLSDMPGAVSPRKHKLERNNIEREVNEAEAERRRVEGPQKFPMHVHKAGGLVRNVTTEEELAAAVAKGWLEDIRDVEAPEPEDAPTMVSRMTLSQAKDFIAANRTDAAFLVAQRADESVHGNRAAVLALLDAAADALPSRATKTRKK